MSMKNPMTPSGIEPATFRLVARCLNQQCHRRTLSKHIEDSNKHIIEEIVRKVCYLPELNEIVRLSVSIGLDSSYEFSFKSDSKYCSKGG
jgi:hypothetical protein